MSKRKEYGGIDMFRIIAAFLVVGIHTAPFEELSSEADRLITYGVGRVGVPFFLMVTGYFVLSECSRGGGKRQRHRLIKYFRRTFLIYLAATLLYLPVAAYAGNLPEGIGEWIRGFCMDGLFYHLWYFPALLIGSLLTAACLWYLPQAAGGMIVLILYAIGLIGDSWYGLIADAAPVRGFYELLFHISSYTRNGFFFAPLFLWMGAVMGKMDGQEEEREKEGRLCRLWKEIEIHPAVRRVLLAVFLLCMMAESWITWELDWQRHDSMYLFLVPVMFLLMKELLMIRTAAPALLRSLSMWIYLLHPLCIVGIRGVSRALHIQQVVVDNQLIFYITVCIVSMAVAFIVARQFSQHELMGKNRRRRDFTNGAPELLQNKKEKGKTKCIQREEHGLK